MSIRAKMVTDLTPLDDIQTYIGNSIQVVGRMAERAASKTLSGAKRELGVQPGPTGTPGRKIEWTGGTGGLQHTAYFASNGFGGGIPYRRSGGLAKAWRGIIKTENKVVTFTINNPSRAARFVYGSLALSNLTAAARFQQRFHKITGWIFAAPVVKKWMEEYQKNVIEGLNQAILEIGTPKFKRRGITPRLPKKKGRGSGR